MSDCVIVSKEIFCVHVASVLKKGVIDGVVVCRFRGGNKLESFGKNLGSGFRKWYVGEVNYTVVDELVMYLLV